MKSYNSLNEVKVEQYKLFVVCDFYYNSSFGTETPNQSFHFSSRGGVYYAPKTPTVAYRSQINFIKSCNRKIFAHCSSLSFTIYVDNLIFFFILSVLLKTRLDEMEQYFISARKVRNFLFCLPSSIFSWN